MGQRKLKQIQIENQKVCTDRHFADRLIDELDGIITGINLLENYEIDFYDDNAIFKEIEFGDRDRMLKYTFTYDILIKKVRLVFKLKGKRSTIDEISIDVGRRGKGILIMTLKPFHATELEIDNFFKILKSELYSE